MNNLEQYYQILKLKKTASLTEIKQAYRQQARKYHPDRFVNEPEKQQEAQEKFKQINQAYEMLKAYFSQDQKAVTQDIITKKTTPEFYYNLGIQTAEKGNYEESLDYFARAIKLNSEYLEALLYRKTVLEKLGFENRAKADARRILEIELNLRKTAYQQQKYTGETTNKIPKNSPINTPWQYKSFLKEHSGAVNAILNYQDQYFVSAGNDKTIKIWNSKNFSLINTLKGHSGKINSIDLSKNGKILVSGSKDKTIKIWDIIKGNLLITLGGLFSGHSDQVLAVKLTNNHKYILSTSLDKTIKLWDIETRKEIYTIKDLLYPISALMLSPDGQIFVSIWAEKYVIIRNIKNGKIIKSINVNSKILAIAYHPKQAIIAIGCQDGTIKLFNLEMKQKILDLKGNFIGISALLFSFDGNYLISVDLDNMVIRWNLKNGKKIDYFQPQVKQILSLAISLNGKTLILGTNNGQISIWDNNI